MLVYLCHRNVDELAIRALLYYRGPERLYDELDLILFENERFVFSPFYSTVSVLFAVVYCSEEGVP